MDIGDNIMRKINEITDKELQMWINGVSNSINTFMFLSPPKESSLNDIFNTKHEKLLRDVTEYFCKEDGGFSPSEFKMLLEASYEPYQLEKMNEAIKNFGLLENCNNIWSLLRTMDYNRGSETDKKEKNKKAEVYTPLELIDAMLDKLPAGTWTDINKTFLDPSCGRGVFLLRIKERLMESLKLIIQDDDEREKHIIENMLFGHDIRPLQVKIAERVINFKGKYKTNLTIKNTLGDK